MNRRESTLALRLEANAIKIKNRHPADAMGRHVESMPLYNLQRGREKVQLMLQCSLSFLLSCFFAVYYAV